MKVQLSVSVWIKAETDEEIDDIINSMEIISVGKDGTQINLDSEVWNYEELE